MRKTFFIGSVLVFCATLGMRAADQPRNAETEQTSLLTTAAVPSCVCPAYKMFMPVMAGTSYWYCTRAACEKDAMGNCTGKFVCLGAPVGDYLPDNTPIGRCDATCSMTSNCRKLGSLTAARTGGKTVSKTLPSGKLHVIPASAELQYFGFEFGKKDKNPHIKNMPKKAKGEGVAVVDAIEELEDGTTATVRIPLHLVVYKVKFKDGGTDKYLGLGTEVVSAPEDVPPVANVDSIELMQTFDGQDIDRLYVVKAMLKDDSHSETFIVRTSKVLVTAP